MNLALTTLHLHRYMQILTRLSDALNHCSLLANHEPVLAALQQPASLQNIPAMESSTTRRDLRHSRFQKY